MRGLRAVLVGLALAGAATASAADLSPWVQGTARLEEAISALCAEPGPQRLNAARGAYATALDGWQAARPQLTLPTLDPDLPARVWFWPDKHGTSGRQMSQALEGRGSGEGLPARGLGMIELVLFDPRSTPLRPAPGGPRACALAQAAAERQAEIAASTASVVEAARPSDDQRQKLALLSLRDSLDRIVQEKIERPLGTSLATAQGSRAEAWRSGRSLAAMRATLESLIILYRNEGLGAALRDAPGGNPIDRAMRAGLDEALALLARIDRPLDQAVVEAKPRAAVALLLAKVKELRLMVVGKMAPALDQSLGFNSLDGD